MKPYLKPVIACVFLIGAVLSWQQSEKTKESSRPDWKKISPFTAVSFEGETIHAEYEGTVYELASIGGVSSTELITAAKKQFGLQWQKRIREDIAEVLEAAGMPDSVHVDLELKEQGSGEVKRVLDAEMTKANRSKIYNPS